MQVIGSQFSERNTDGDFGWMISRPDYADALFIFNDNEEQFRAYLADPTPGSDGCRDGAGNAAIRHWRCEHPPRAAGIPTGSSGRGYASLTDPVQRVIDEAFAFIKGVLASGSYTRVIYSASNANGDLGTGIFEVGDDVRRYIVGELRKLEKLEAARDEAVR